MARRIIHVTATSQMGVTDDGDLLFTSRDGEDEVVIQFCRTTTHQPFELAHDAVMTAVGAYTNLVIREYRG